MAARPPGTGVADADTSSPAVKMRMPPEIKHRLAKVARLAHAIHGKISKELLNRLMGIVGHLIQLRSLRRNLVNMVNMGLSAKEEKDTRMQQLKKQIEEMVKIRAPMMMSKAMEQQLVGESDDFQESGTKEKEILKRKLTIDDTLEDKICVLYDLSVEGLDEDAGPQVRKLYAELAEMWPKGLMGNHGIRGAICRAKNRRKVLHRHNNKRVFGNKGVVQGDFIYTSEEYSIMFKSTMEEARTKIPLITSDENSLLSQQLGTKRQKYISHVSKPDHHSSNKLVKFSFIIF